MQTSHICLPKKFSFHTRRLSDLAFPPQNRRRRPRWCWSWCLGLPQERAGRRVWLVPGSTASSAWGSSTRACRRTSSPGSRRWSPRRHRGWKSRWWFRRAQGAGCIPSCRPASRSCSRFSFPQQTSGPGPSFSHVPVHSQASVNSDPVILRQQPNRKIGPKMWIQSTHFTFDQPTSISLRAILMSFNSKRSASLANFHSFSISANEIQSVVEQHFDIMAMHCPINIVNCSISTSSTYPLAVREDPVNERLHVANRILPNSGSTHLWWSCRTPPAWISCSGSRWKQLGCHPSSENHLVRIRSRFFLPLNIHSSPTHHITLEKASEHTKPF